MKITKQFNVQEFQLLKDVINTLIKEVKSQSQYANNEFDFKLELNLPDQGRLQDIAEKFRTFSL